MDAFEVLPMMVVFMIPIVAIIGGITAGIIKSVHRQRLLELAQKERIAAIERGLDPDKLPALNLPPELLSGPKNGLTFEQKQLRRSQNLLIWGLILFLGGLALGIGLAFAESDPGSWIAGTLLAGVGLALLISSRVVRPEREMPPRAGSSP
jgi:hypothetical protein